MGDEAGRYTIYDHIETLPGGREELIEEIEPDYPCLCLRSEHDRYAGRVVPWHWHQELELFWCESGEVVYEVPHQTVTVRPGDAGLVNANVIHSTHAADGMAGANLKIHMFRPTFLAEADSRIWERCVEPMISATSVGLLVARASGTDGQVRLCRLVEESFRTFERADAGWELRLRDQVGEAWLGFLDMARPRLAGGPAALPRASQERLRAMIDYVGKHYFERVSVGQIAAAGFSSERECYRTFRDELGTTPVSYLREYRVQQACRMLAHTTRPLSAVAQMSGLGSPSHFGKVFRESIGQTPSEYRRMWQNLDSQRRQTE